MVPRVMHLHGHVYISILKRSLTWPPSFLLWCYQPFHHICNAQEEQNAAGQFKTRQHVKNISTNKSLNVTKCAHCYDGKNKTNKKNVCIILKCLPWLHFSSFSSCLAAFRFGWSLSITRSWKKYKQHRLKFCLSCGKSTCISKIKWKCLRWDVQLKQRMLLT